MAKRLEAWQAEKEKYELKEVGKGVFAFKLKDVSRGNEPSHYLCVGCLEGGKKSILQDTKVEKYSTRVHRCHLCSAEYLFGVAERRDQQVELVRVRNRYNPFP